MKSATACVATSYQSESRSFMSGRSCCQVKRKWGTDSASFRRVRIAVQRRGLVTANEPATPQRLEPGPRPL
jgi:hypothetical protein